MKLTAKYNIKREEANASESVYWSGFTMWQMTGHCRAFCVVMVVNL